MGSFTLNLKNYIKSLVYDKDEIDAQMNGKAAANHEHGDLYYTETEIDTQMGTKVDKVSGKGLSTNDFTTAEKSKLASLENITVDAALSGTSENPVQNKVVKNALDSKAASSHTHNASEVTDSSTYSNLETSAGATQAVINSAINTKMGALLNVELITVVQSLPTASESTMNKMYLVAESTSKTNDNYEILITVKSGNNYAWEKVDTARLDLSGYMQIANFNPSFDNDTGILTIDY